jgi:hypothetical protein
MRTLMQSLGVAVGALLGLAAIGAAVTIVALLSLATVRDGSAPRLLSYETVGRLAVVLGLVVLAVALRNTLSAWMRATLASRERRKAAANEEWFWQTVAERRSAVATRLSEWEAVETRAREAYVLEQERLADAMLANTPPAGSSRRLTREERTELGLELSPSEIDRLRLLTPFFSSPPGAGPQEPPPLDGDHRRRG